VTALPLDNVALAPDPGAPKLTVTPDSGLFPASRTTTTNDEAKPVLIAVDCPLPLTTLTLAGALAVFVRLKSAGVATPLTLALTV
jgi:hypothetical protein